MTTFFKALQNGTLKKQESNLKMRQSTEGFWILPTISRPQNISRLIESYRSVGESAPVVVFLWKDDPDLGDNMAQKWPENWLVLVEEERFTAGDAMRRAVKYAPKAEFYGFLADDVVFHTAWSHQLAEAATPCFIAYPDDGVQHERLCTHFVVGGELVRELGWWALPNLQHAGLDMVWMVLGQNVPGALKYRPDVLWEHLHPIVEKAEKDSIYEYADSLKEKDNEVYQEWLQSELPRDAKKLKEVLYG